MERDHWRHLCGGECDLTKRYVHAHAIGLAPATGYTYRAFVEADGEVIYGEVAFTTDSILCPAPTNLEETGVIIDKAPGYLFVRWTDNAGASQWNLQYRIRYGRLEHHSGEHHGSGHYGKFGSLCDVRVAGAGGLQ